MMKKIVYSSIFILIIAVVFGIQNSNKATVESNVVKEDVNKQYTNDYIATLNDPKLALDPKLVTNMKLSLDLIFDFNDINKIQNYFDSTFIVKINKAKSVYVDQGDIFTIYEATVLKSTNKDISENETIEIYKGSGCVKTSVFQQSLGSETEKGQTANASNQFTCTFSEDDINLEVGSTVLMMTEKKPLNGVDKSFPIGYGNSTMKLENGQPISNTTNQKIVVEELNKILKNAEIRKTWSEFSQ
ncbi:MAG: hypothetical protein ACRCUP_03925 [Mycoplasmatales bacterium]